MTKYSKIFIYILLATTLILIVAFNKNRIHHKELINRSLDNISSLYNNVDGFLITSKDGYRFVVDQFDDTVSKRLVEKKDWEPFMTKLLSKTVKNGDNILCLGTHIGYHLIHISKLAGNDGHVYAFEANPRTLNYTKLNITLNNENNITLFNKAVYSSEGEIKFVTNKKSGNTGASHILRSSEIIKDDEIVITVPTVRIDDVLSDVDHIDMIQMDIEGAEIEALKGAEKLIARSPRIIPG